MSSVSIQSKDDKGTYINKIVNVIVVAVPIIAIFVVLLLSGGEKTDSRLTTGEWQQTTDNARHIVFRTGNSIAMTSPSASGAWEEGSFTPNIDGMVTVDMKDGKRYAITFREFTPNQFDLQDRQTGGVTVYKKMQ